MLFSSFISWWYGSGWKHVATSLTRRLQSVSDSFSVQLLVPTLFEPWRRIVTPPGRSLEERMRALADNAFSRVIGFVVRLFVLLAATVVALIVGLLTIIEVIAWPLVPLALPGLIVMGILI